MRNYTEAKKWHQEKGFKKFRVEPHINMVSGNGGYLRYWVRYTNSYICCDRKFGTLEDAKNFKNICEDLINRARLENSTRTKVKSRELKEYPETLLSVLGITPDNYEDYYTNIVKNFDKNFECASKILKEKERDIIINRYKNYLTLEEVGKKYNLTRERIRQIESIALKKLKHNSVYKYFIRKEDKFEIISEEERNIIVAEYRAKVFAELETEKLKMTYEYAKEVVAKYEGTYGRPLGNIEDLDLSLRSFNCLKRANIYQLGDLCNHTEKEIIGLKNLGKKCLREIKRELKKKGLHLKEEEIGD